MILALVPLFFMELFASMWVGEQIGFGPSVLWIIVTMIAGSLYLKNSPYALMGNLASAHLGKLNIQNANRASMAYLVGAVSLIIPGVISDGVGLILLMYSFYLRLLAKITPPKPNRFDQQKRSNQEKGDEDVIDVEIVDD